MTAERKAIPLVGPPLAGKLTIGRALAAAHSKPVELTMTIVDKGPFAGPCHTYYVDLENGPLIYRISAISGGPPIEASIKLLEGAERGVFVLDPQLSSRDRQIKLWQTVAPLLPQEAWYFIINKMDLVRREDILTEPLGSPAEIRTFLRVQGIPENRPWIEICAIETASIRKIVEFFDLVCE